MDRIVPVYIADVDTALLTYNQVRLYYAPSPTTDNIALVDTETLVEDVHTYTMLATGGSITRDTWFMWRLYNTTGPVEGPMSSPFQLQGILMAELRRIAAAEAGMGFSSTTTSNGTTSSLVDVVLRDQGLSATYLGASWIDRYPEVAFDDSDRIRRLAVTGFDPDDGGLVPLRVWSVAPQADEPYSVYGLIPPIQQAGTTYSWDDAIRDGLNACWYDDEVIVMDPATEDDERTNQIPLTSVPWLRENMIRAVYSQKIDDDGNIYRANLTKRGSYWDIRDLGFGERVLVLPWYPPTGYSVVVSCFRQPDLPYKDDDVIPIDTDVAKFATVMAAYDYLNRVPATKGQYAVELAGATREWQRYYKPFRPRDAMVGA